MISFGDEKTRQAYDRECDKLRRAQKVRFAVAPLSRVVTSRRTFEAGQEITPAELDALPGCPTPDSLMRALVRKGLVLEAERMPRTCAKPIGRISPSFARGVAMGAAGILVAGDDVAGDDVPKEVLDQLVQRGVVELVKGAWARGVT